jgi:hypothetical protein
MPSLGQITAVFPFNLCQIRPTASDIFSHKPAKRADSKESALAYADYRRLVYIVMQEWIVAQFNTLLTILIDCFI